MASLARIEGFLEALAATAKSGARHLWLDNAQLVVGNFPDVNRRYDFAAERFVSTAVKVVAAPKKVVSLLAKAGRVRTILRIETSDAVYEVGSATQLLVEGLNIVERLRPGTIEQLSAAKGRTKRPVAPTRDELYDYPHPPKHSTKLQNGYFVGTNNKAQEAIGVLRRAIDLAGLADEVKLHLKRA